MPGHHQVLRLFKWKPQEGGAEEVYEGGLVGSHPSIEENSYVIG
jgi:hypothetical protein